MTWAFRTLTAALLLGAFAAWASAQPAPTRNPPSPPPAQQAEKPKEPEEQPQTDVFDLLRALRHKDKPSAEQPAWDYRKKMVAIAPVIGYKPSSGLMFGAAGNVASYRGDPKTTHISSAVVSLTFSAKKQTALSARYTTFARDDRWRAEGDNRAQWTSQDSYGLGTGTTAGARINAKYNFFRVYETAYCRLRPSLFAGLGLHWNLHSNVGPGSGTTDEAWEQSPYVRYSEEHGFPLDHQASAGTSVNLLLDSRDNPLNAGRGWYLNTAFRTFYGDFLGGDSTWQELLVDVRKYRSISQDGRKRVAVWVFGDFVTGGYAPYLDMPATAMDTYGRSGRGYGEGRFRGERMFYAEVEYRATLTRNGLVGMVVFLNVTTVTNLHTDERLFDTYAPGGGAGLRLLINKRSKTNLCLDFGFGKEGSRGVYLAIQEAF